MKESIDHDTIEAALQRAGSSWAASQAHGLLCSRLSVVGADGAADWLALVFEGADPHNALLQEGSSSLQELAADTWRRLSERQSDFAPLLPGESESTTAVTAALAQWCEGYLHGLVSGVEDQTLKARLAAEPISDIIKDMLEITRAEADDSEDDQENEQALTELVEYIRVTTQLVFEELAELRHKTSGIDDAGGADTIH